MFCTKCGAKLKEGARFCIYCGQPAEDSQPAQPTQPASQPGQPQPAAPAWEEEPVWEEPPKKSHRLLPLWIALGVVALAAVAVIVIQFLPIGEQADAGRARGEDRAAASVSVAVTSRKDEDSGSSAPAEEEVPVDAADSPAEEGAGESAQTEAVPAGNGADFVPSQTQTDAIIAQGGKYINARFGYTLMVPDGFAASRESENGDGLTLYNEEQDMRITVYGGYQTGESTGELFDQACAEIPGTLGYHTSGEDWYAVSSEDGEGMIHYRKYGAWDGKYRVMELVYPKANEGVCDQLTEELEDGFVSGTQN